MKKNKALKQAEPMVESSEKKKETWSQSAKKGNLTRSINVEKLDNGGYLVTIEMYGYKPDDKKQEKYISSTSKLYSETNPLDEDETNDPIMDAYTTLMAK